jgi:Flp pilus assembly protein TadD
MAIVSATAAFAHFAAGRYDEASSRAEQVLLEKPNYHLALRTVAASHALAGRLDLAQNALSRLREIDPADEIIHLLGSSARVRSKTTGAERRTT